MPRAHHLVVAALLAAWNVCSTAAEAVLLTADPATVSDGGSVSISWPHDYKPTPGEYISYTCGPVNNVTDDIGRCPLNSSHATAGESAAELRDHPPQLLPGRCLFVSLANMRCVYTFNLVRPPPPPPPSPPASKASGPGPGPAIIASVSVSVLQGPAAPSQGHIAFGDSPDEMYVSWVSGSNTSSGNVRFGLASGNLTESTAVYDVTTYTAGQVCDYPANTTTQSYWRHPGYFHHVLLTGLKPGTTWALISQLSFSTLFLSQFSFLASSPSPANTARSSV